MARIRLEIYSMEQQVVLDSQGTRLVLPFVRLATFLYVGQHPKVWDGLIDTGSPFTLVPKIVWEKFPELIEWFSFPPGTSPPPWWTTASGLTGGSFPCRLGRFPLSVADRKGLRLPEVPVIAKFVEDDGRLQRMVLGLHDGILEDRRLIVDQGLAEAWLEERDPQGPNR